MFINFKLLNCPISENTHCWGKDHCMAGLQFNKLELTNEGNIILFVFSEAA